MFRLLNRILFPEGKPDARVGLVVILGVCLAVYSALKWFLS